MITTKATFARMCNVTRACISQWIKDRIISGEAIVGEGHSARRRPGADHVRDVHGVTLGLLPRHPGGPTLAVAPDLKGEASPLQGRQGAAHGHALGVADEPSAVGPDQHAVDLGGELEGREAGLLL